MRAVNIKKCYDEVGFPMFENFCYFPFITPTQEKDWKVKMPEEWPSSCCNAAISESNLTQDMSHTGEALRKDSITSCTYGTSCTQVGITPSLSKLTYFPALNK